jgi:hypothetical protein
MIRSFVPFVELTDLCVPAGTRANEAADTVHSPQAVRGGSD